MSFPSSTPTAQGIDPAGIAAFVAALDTDPAIEPHGLIIQRHGKRVAEGYWAPHTGDRIRLQYSLSKTFTGTALALLLGEGRLRLDDLVSDHLPEACAGMHPALRGLRVRHVASMASGHDRETLPEARANGAEHIARDFLRIAPAAAPGTLFAYNQPPVVVLATILQRLAGMRLVDYLRPRLFDVLGMGDVRWRQLYAGMDYGFSGVYASLDAVARLGQLYLDDGVWNGARLLPEGWVAQASRPQIDNSANIEPDWRQGYGFQLWCSRHGYRGDGAFGQYMVVLPEHDTVVAMFSCTATMQRVLDHLWQHLLPALHHAPRAPSAADDALAHTLAALHLPTARQRIGAGAFAPFSGRFQPGELGLNAQRSLTDVNVEGSTLVLQEGERSLHVPLDSVWASTADGSVAASAGRTPDGRTVIDLAFLETPHRLELTLDPATGTFLPHWPVPPISGAGIASTLGYMRAPP